ncbi:MAG TPA: hypothetical protein VE986_02420 [Hyphomicrobiales bacterium]|nr:hypothetical protein [Hyphomicrobiales bacterium]
MLADLKLSLNPERVTLENPRPELKGQIAPEVQARLSIVPKGNTNITNRRFREGLAGGGLVFNHGFRAFLGSIVFAAYILVVFFF